MEERKKAFKEKIILNGLGYPQEMLDAFLDYWTESNEGGKKMRFEMQKIFDISRRLKTWQRNTQAFTMGKKAPTPITYIKPPEIKREEEIDWVKRWYAKSKEEAINNPPVKEGLGDLIRKQIYKTNQ